MSFCYIVYTLCIFNTKCSFTVSQWDLIIQLQRCVIVWELRVVGWEVSHGAEFVPSTEGGYTVVINKVKKMTPNDEPVVHGSFTVSELGKLLLIVDNPTSKKKKLLYRFKEKPLSD